jgi:hypothetical protein
MHHCERTASAKISNRVNAQPQRGSCEGARNVRRITTFRHWWSRRATVRWHAEGFTVHMIDK